MHYLVLTFESVDEILKSAHSNESYRAVLASGAARFSLIFSKMISENICHFEVNHIDFFYPNSYQTVTASSSFQLCNGYSSEDVHLRVNGDAAGRKLMQPCSWRYLAS